MYPVSPMSNCDFPLSSYLRVVVPFLESKPYARPKTSSGNLKKLESQSTWRNDQILQVPVRSSMFLSVEPISLLETLHSLKANRSHLKMDGWNTSYVSLWGKTAYFQGANWLLVYREGKSQPGFFSLRCHYELGGWKSGGYFWGKMRKNDPNFAAQTVGGCCRKRSSSFQIATPKRIKHVPMSFNLCQIHGFLVASKLLLVLGRAAHLIFQKTAERLKGPLFAAAMSICDHPFRKLRPRFLRERSEWQKLWIAGDESYGWQPEIPWGPNHLGSKKPGK